MSTKLYVLVEQYGTEEGVEGHNLVGAFRSLKEAEDWKDSLEEVDDLYYDIFYTIKEIEVNLT